MTSDHDILIGLAAVYARLITPDELCIDSPDSMTAVLMTRFGENAMAALRIQARDSYPLTDLTTALGVLSVGLRKHAQERARAKTLPELRQAPPSDTPPSAPTILDESPGRYERGEEHARGGMGRVLMIYDRYLARRVAMKELLPRFDGSHAKSTLVVKDSGSDPTTQQQQTRFLYEARITGQLEHPSIVPVYELGRRADGTLYYTMRFMRGRSLRETIRDGKTIQDRLRLLPHVIDLCQAIAFAHSRGVIHRDIKPDNVMVGEFGETVVIDWGLARTTHQAGFSTEEAAPDDAPSTKGAAMGTPAYMAPEQASGEGDAIDERADVYSLGAVLYELLTGQMPYSDTAPSHVLATLLTGPPAPLADNAQGAPEQLIAICNHAMERDPAARYQTAKALAADIERFLSGRLVGVYHYNLRELFSHFVRSFKAPLLVGAVGLVLISSTVFISYQRIQVERDRAVNESIRAQNAERLAIDAQHKAEQEFYFAAISSARKYIEDGRFEKAMDQLDRCPNRFRHWEWGYLLYLCNQDLRTFRAHQPETVWSLTYLPGGTHLASSGFDNTARIWSMESGALQHTYTSPHGAVIEVAAHPHAPLIACAEEAGMVTLYDYAAGAVKDAWQVSEDDINCVQFDPSGTILYTGDDDGFVRRWVWEGHTQDYAIALGDGGIEAMVLSPDGTVLAAVDRGNAIHVLDAKTGTLLAKLAGHEKRIASLAFSPDGMQLVSTSRDATARIWRMDTYEEAQVLSEHGRSAVWAAAFSPDGRKLATASSDLTVQLWDTETWTQIRVYRGHQRQVYCLAFSPSGAYLVSGDDEGTMKQWDTVFPGPQTEAWKLAGHTGEINHVAYSPDGQTIATSAGHWRTADDKTVRLWDANSSSLIKTLEGHAASVRQTIYHPTEAVYATSSHDNTIRIWNRDTDTVLRVLGPFESGVNVAAFSTGDDDVLAAGLRDGHLVFANWREGTIEKLWKEHEKEVLGLTYSPNGKWLVSGSADETAHVLNASDGALIQRIEVHEARVPAVAFSPDGAWLATGGHDWRVNLWDTNTWTLRHTMEGHTQGVYSLQFSDDGRRLISSSSDGATILWDMATFREVFQIEGWVSTMRPGSQDIVTADREGNAYLWPAFSWDEATYAEPAGSPLSQRAEAYSRQFWIERRNKPPQQ